MTDCTTLVSPFRRAVLAAAIGIFTAAFAVPSTASAQATAPDAVAAPVQDEDAAFKTWLQGVYDEGLKKGDQASHP